MARLTAKGRRDLPSKDFAGGKGSYPIENESHARDALAMVVRWGSPAKQAEVRANVRSKYPDMHITTHTSKNTK